MLSKLVAAASGVGLSVKSSDPTYAFVEFQHKRAPVMYRAIPPVSRFACPHLTDSLRQAVAAFGCVETECRECHRDAVASHYATIQARAKAHAEATAAAKAKATPDKPFVEPEPYDCGDDDDDGTAPMVLVLREIALRFLVERVELICVPFPRHLLTLAMKDSLRLDTNAPLREMLAHSLPIVTLQTPLLYVLLMSPMTTAKSEAARFSAQIVSGRLFATYRMMLMAMMAKLDAVDQMLDAAYESTMECRDKDQGTEVVDGKTVGVVVPDKITEMYNRRMKRIAENSKRTEQYIDACLVLWKRCSELAKLARRNAAEELAAPDADEEVVLRKYCARILNSIELHLMTLFNIPRRWHEALKTSPVPQKPSPMIAAMSDGLAISIATVERHLRAPPPPPPASAPVDTPTLTSVATGTSAPPPDTATAALAAMIEAQAAPPADPSKPKPSAAPMFGPQFSDADIASVLSAGDYNRLILRALREGCAPPDPPATTSAADSGAANCMEANASAAAVPGNAKE